MEVLIPVSVGELFDKISILQIKLERIKDQAKLEHVKREFDALQSVVRSNKIEVPDDLYEELKLVNEELWDTEDRIREKEELEQFDNDFVKFARADAIYNDKRFLVKKRINEFCGSHIVEQKSYSQAVLQKHESFVSE